MVQRPIYVTDAPGYERQFCHHITDHKPQCWQCKRVLAGFMTRPWEKKCERCNAMNRSLPVQT